MSSMAQRLFSLCATSLGVLAQASLPQATVDQVAWQGQGKGASDMAVFIHYNIATAAGTQGCNCQGQAPPAIDIWDPSALDTDAWIREGVAMGATRFIYVAKHGCGFLAWNSSTDYPYSAASLNRQMLTSSVASLKVQRRRALVTASTTVS